MSYFKQMSQKAVQVVERESWRRINCRCEDCPGQRGLNAFLGSMASVYLKFGEFTEFKVLGNTALFCDLDNSLRHLLKRGGDPQRLGYELTERGDIVSIWGVPIELSATLDATTPHNYVVGLPVPLYDCQNVDERIRLLTAIDAQPVYFSVDPDNMMEIMLRPDGMGFRGCGPAFTGREEPQQGVPRGPVLDNMPAVIVNAMQRVKERLEAENPGLEVELINGGTIDLSSLLRPQEATKAPEVAEPDTLAPEAVAPDTPAPSTPPDTTTPPITGRIIEGTVRGSGGPVVKNGVHLN